MNEERKELLAEAIFVRDMLRNMRKLEDQIIGLLNDGDNPNHLWEAYKVLKSIDMDGFSEKHKRRLNEHKDFMLEMLI